jgi:hypothetical protein
VSPGPRDEFLSEEDLDLVNLSEEEFDAWNLLWLRAAQATNDLDANVISHGVFLVDPAVPGPPPPRDRFL